MRSIVRVIISNKAPEIDVERIRIKNSDNNQGQIGRVFGRIKK